MGFFGDIWDAQLTSFDPLDISGRKKGQKQEKADAEYAKTIADLSRPDYSTGTNLLNPEGALMHQYRLQARPDVEFSSSLSEVDNRLKGINLNKEGLEAVRKRALTEGPSDWQKLMLQKQGLEEQNAAERAGAQSRGETSGAFSDLARRGGLSSGARERLAASGARGLSQARQGVLRAGMGQRLDIGAQDEQQRLALLAQLPGMEVQALQPELEKTRLFAGQAESENARKQNLELANRSYSTDIDKTNLSNTLGEISRQDAQKLAEYQEKMKTYAAERQSAATARAGGGGGKK